MLLNMQAVLLAALGIALAAAQEIHTGFYVHPSRNRFLQLGQKHNTDKVSDHNYETLYGRMFEVLPGMFRTSKLLEIGLGCNMGYGPGHSAKVWREYLPEAELWFGEYNEECVRSKQAEMDKMGINVVTGDQANITTLQRWVEQTNAKQKPFDVIIDDGGHSNMQMYNSFMVLFEQALRPGGAYVIEDLHCSREAMYWDGQPPGGQITIDIIKDWIDELVMHNYPSPSPTQKWHKPARVKSIECSREACLIVKCYDTDQRCY